jgi:hypothetical protein
VDLLQKSPRMNPLLCLKPRPCPAHNHLAPHTTTFISDHNINKYGRAAPQQRPGGRVGGRASGQGAHSLRVGADQLHRLSLRGGMAVSV